MPEPEPADATELLDVIFHELQWHACALPNELRWATGREPAIQRGDRLCRGLPPISVAGDLWRLGPHVLLD